MNPASIPASIPAHLRLSRRTALMLAAGSATAGLAACGGSGGAGSPSGGGASAGGGAGAGAGGPLAALKDVPVGGAVSATSPDGKPVIIAQPTEGTVVGFSAICTHMGCTVAPAGTQLDCPCHGSVYDAATGKNLSGPAPRPLAPFPVHLDGEQVLPGA
jgi:nitrite reductase/ring-hydroxylating ferredoxin subunit